MSVDAQPLISIIVPVYRVEKYLEKCVDSLIKQTYTNLEIILVDDGSPDACPAICDQFEKTDTRTKVIHKANGGLSDARNAGLEIAKGEYIGFVDSDDFVAPNMYEVLLNVAENCDADIAVCNYMRVNDDGKIESVGKYAADRTYTRDEFICELMQPYGDYYIVVWNKLYKRSLFCDLQFPFGKQHEDQFIIHYIIDRCNTIASTKECLYYYVQREGSIMAHGIDARTLDVGEAFIDRYYFTKSRKYDQWKDHCVYRLSYALDNWKKYADKDNAVHDKYEELRKKSRFLIFEKAAWAGKNMHLRGKIFMRLEHISPIIARLIRRLFHKNFNEF